MQAAQHRADARPEWLAAYTREALAARLAGMLDALCGASR